MNGYFQIVNRGGKCYVKLIPPTDGGEPIRREELTEYLNFKNITYDIKVLAQVLAGLQNVGYYPTPTDYRFNDGEFVKVMCAPDNMSVTVRMIPNFESGIKMTKQEFMREFSARGICYGFDELVIDKFLKERPYCTDVIVARGTPPVHGTDARIEYFFNTDPKAKPTLNEDGSVDFFHLNTINHCQAGDLLARLTPAEFGETGRNVKGELIKPRDVKQNSLKYGHNIEANADRTEIRSMVSGHVSLVEGKVFVSNVFEVENVDNSIGNIDYDGSVCVNGNVCENFSIRAKGSIEVKGIVEGAYLEAGDNITIARGMAGMHKGILKAGGNVVAKFIENAKVHANGFVEADSIMHSEVVAGSDIKVSGSRGFITGGRVCATYTIEVKNLGSPMGADTIVEVGMDTSIKTSMQELVGEIKEINTKLVTIRPVLEGAKEKLKRGIKMSSAQLLQLQKLAVLNKELTERLTAANSELSSYADSDSPSNTSAGQIIVTGEVYQGTKICIGDVSMVVKNGMKYCRFVKEGGEVKMVAIY